MERKNGSTNGSNELLIFINKIILSTQIINAIEQTQPNNSTDFQTRRTLISCMETSKGIMLNF